MDKAVVTLLIRSFSDDGEVFAHYSYTLSCYIMMQQEVVVLREKEYHLYLSDDEYIQILQSLVRLKNNLIAQDRYTDAVDDVLCKLLLSKKKKIKVEYI